MENDPETSALVRAVIELNRRRHKEAAKKICARIGIDFTEDENSAQYKYMIYHIGYSLIYESKEFKQLSQGKRGRKAAVITDAERYSYIADTRKEQEAKEGKKITDKQIAYEIADAIQASDPQVFKDPAVIQQQISRGRDLRQKRYQFARKTK